MKTTTHRRAFSLIELLVVISIVAMLMTMMAAALSAARTSSGKQITAARIRSIDTIVQAHYASLESSRAAAVGPPAERGARIRRLITADMPDNWNEVENLKTLTGEFSSARHRSYVATRDALIAQNPGAAGLTKINANASAECLFMIIMQGGLSDCLDCASLSSITVGDTDGDGAPEFLDAWGQPIRYILWPGGFQLPPGDPEVGPTFFDGSIAPFENAVSSAPGGTMRPLILSGGPSKDDATEIIGHVYLGLGLACGRPDHDDIKDQGGLVKPTAGNPSPQDNRLDNITNFDEEGGL